MWKTIITPLDFNTKKQEILLSKYAVMIDIHNVLDNTLKRIIFEIMYLVLSLNCRFKYINSEILLIAVIKQKLVVIIVDLFLRFL